MILDIYKDAFEYSAKDWKALIILGVMCLFSFLIIPAFLIAGYGYRVENTAVHGIINGNDPLPEFDDIFEMFIEGVKVFLVQIAYLLVPMILFILVVAIAGSIDGSVGGTVFIIGGLITFVVGIIACLMAQIGICHMAYNDGAFSKAFAISEIREVLNDIGWLKCLTTYAGLIIITLILSCAVTAIIGIIFTVLGITGGMLGANAGGIFVLGTFINSLVTMFIVGPYLSIFNTRSIGLLYTMQI